MLIVSGSLVYNIDHFDLLYITKPREYYRIGLEIIPDKEYIVGGFATEARATEVLNEIIAAYERGEKVYRMPEE